MADSRQPKAAPRGLVLGHLERISSNVFVKHKDVITDMVGGTNGIYALYRNKQLYYVGLAIDLKKRVNHHLKDKHAGKWTHFSLYLVRSEKHLRDLESLAIRIAFPRGNTMKMRLPGAKDLRKPLQKKLKAKVIAEIATIMGHDGEATPKKPVRNKPATKDATPTSPVPDQTKAAKGEPPLKGFFPKRTRLLATFKGKEYQACVLNSGRIKRLDTKELFNSPSAAAAAICDRPTCNGWRFWQAKDRDGNWVPLSTLRKL